MRILSTSVLIFLSECSVCEAQDSLRDLKEIKLHSKAVVTTDSGTQKGFLWQVTDSSLILSPKKNIPGNSVPLKYFIIPAENISMLSVKNKRFPFAEMAGGTLLGFVLTAGIWENEDENQDGKLSFLELLWGAIDRTSSRNRQRRKVAIWVGVGGGVAGLVAGALSSRKLTLSFHLDNRRSDYQDNKERLKLLIQ